MNAKNEFICLTSHAENYEKKAKMFDVMEGHEEAMESWQEAKKYWEMALALIQKCKLLLNQEFDDSDVMKCDHGVARCFIETIISKRKNQRKIFQLSTRP